MNRSILTLTTLLSLTACDPVSPDIDGPDADVVLTQFSSCKAMGDFVAEATLNSMIQSAYGWRSNDMDMATLGGAEEDGGTSAPSDYSTTNTQEKGVDEPDMVKTDGEYIYVIQDGELVIVDSWPVDEAEIVGRISVGDGASSMFLSDDKIAVYSERWAELADGSWTGLTDIRIIDLTERANPKLARTMSIDGSLVSARMIGSDVYTVIRRDFRLPDSAWDSIWEASKNLPEPAWDASDLTLAASRYQAERILRPTIYSVIGELNATDLLPHVIHNDGTEEPLSDCVDVYHADEASEAALSAVVHLDLGADKPRITQKGASVMGGGLTTYASQTNLFVAQNSASWWDGFSEIERSTRIHRFALDADRVEYAGSGVVDGYLHNQFSMSEYKGMLRVATTDNDWWFGTSTDGEANGNNVFVLDITQGQMGLVGELRGLAPGEQIYSARFQGDRGYLVTFVQIDPLFTIDLSNPTQPKAKGELKIPGYSAYLHPFGTDHVIGVGADGGWEGGISGVAINLFDVSDFADPIQQDTLTLDMDDSWSEALWDHHAITIHNSILAMPVYGWNYDDGSGWEDRSGLLVTQIDADDGITKVGLINHSDVAEAGVCGNIPDCEVDIYDAQMRRSVIIEDHIFSISMYGMKVNALEDPETDVATVIF